MKFEYAVNGDGHRLEKALRQMKKWDRELRDEAERARTVQPQRRRLKDRAAGRRRFQEHKYNHTEE